MTKIPSAFRILKLFISKSAVIALGAVPSNDKVLENASAIVLKFSLMASVEP